MPHRVLLDLFPWQRLQEAEKEDILVTFGTKQIREKVKTWNTLMLSEYALAYDLTLF
jgi:hypothetical protein